MSRLHARLVKLEQADTYGRLSEKEANHLLLDALRAANMGSSVPMDDDGTPGESLDVMLAGTQAGAFLVALGGFGRSVLTETAP